MDCDQNFAFHGRRIRNLVERERLGTADNMAAQRTHQMPPPTAISAPVV